MQYLDRKIIAPIKIWRIKSFWDSKGEIKMVNSKIKRRIYRYFERGKRRQKIRWIYYWQYNLRKRGEFFVVFTSFILLKFMMVATKQSPIIN